MILLVVIVLLVWLILAAFRRIEATALGGLIFAGVIVVAFGWPVLVVAAAVVAVRLFRGPLLPPGSLRR